MPPSQSNSLKSKTRVTAGAVPAQELKAPFPKIALSVRPPFAPMEAKSVQGIFSGGRFRHGTKFMRWRLENAPGQCTFEQVMPSRAGRGLPEFLESAA
jgi:hypothetical protein